MKPYVEDMYGWSLMTIFWSRRVENTKCLIKTPRDLSKVFHDAEGFSDFRYWSWGWAVQVPWWTLVAWHWSGHAFGRPRRHIRWLRHRGRWATGVFVWVGPWLKMTLNRIAHILFKFQFELISRIQEISCLWYFSNFLGDKILMWKKRSEHVALLWHCCILAGTDRRIRERYGEFDSQLCKRSPWLQLGPVKVLGGKVFVHGVHWASLRFCMIPALAVDHGCRLLLSKST